MYLDKIAIFVGIGLLIFMVLSFVVKYFIRNKE
jgi:hypothetical protein